MKYIPDMTAPIIPKPKNFESSLRLNPTTATTHRYYCPRGYGECEDARGCVYPGRCTNIKG